MVRALFILLCLCFGSAASAQSKSNTVIIGATPLWLHINQGDEFSVQGSDNVSDGCWTNVSATKNAVAIELQRSGYAPKVVQEGSFFGNRIVLMASGYATSNGLCIVNYSLMLWVPLLHRSTIQKHDVSSLFALTLWEHGGVMSGPKSEINERIKTTFVELTQSLILAVGENQKDVVKKITASAQSDEDATPEQIEFWSNYKVE